MKDLKKSGIDSGKLFSTSTIIFHFECKVSKKKIQRER